MFALSDAVMVASVTASAAVIVGSVPLLMLLVTRATDKSAKKVMTRNSAEHVVNGEALSRIEWQIAGLGTLMTDHLSWHTHNPPQQKKDAA